MWLDLCGIAKGYAVDRMVEVLDSMAVDLEYLGRESYMPLFIVLRPGHTLDDALKARRRHSKAGQQGENESASWCFLCLFHLKAMARRTLECPSNSL